MRAKTSVLMLMILVCLHLLLPYVVDAKGEVRIAYVRHSDNSLWVMSYPSGAKTKVYGRGVTGDRLLSFGDGHTVVAGSVFENTSLALFDVSKPGKKYSIAKLDPMWDQWAAEFARDGNGILAAKNMPLDQDGYYAALYAVRPDGRRILVAKPPRKYIIANIHARYSPDKMKLLVAGDDFAQVLDVSTGKTILYKQFEEIIVDDIVWFDYSHAVISSEGWGSKLILVDLNKNTMITPWLRDISPDSIAYAEDEHRLYALNQSTKAGAGKLYRINPDTGQYNPVTLPFSGKIAKLNSVTPDGKMLLISTPNPKASSDSSFDPDYGRLWLVDMETAKRTLISENAQGIFIR